MGSGTTLEKAVRTLATDVQTFTLSLFVPVYGYNEDSSPLSFCSPDHHRSPCSTGNAQFSLEASGSFPFTQSITISSYSLSVNSGSQNSVAISATASVALANQKQPLTFSISTNWQEGTSVSCPPPENREGREYPFADQHFQVSFRGSLQGTWQRPFDFGWLSAISSVSLSITVSGSGSVSSAKVAITGKASLSSAPSHPFSFTIDVIESGDWLFSVTDFPIAGQLTTFYRSVVGAPAPRMLDDVNFEGQVHRAPMPVVTLATGSFGELREFFPWCSFSGQPGTGHLRLGIGETGPDCERDTGHDHERKQRAAQGRAHSPPVGVSAGSVRAEPLHTHVCFFGECHFLPVGGRQIPAVLKRRCQLLFRIRHASSGSLPSSA